MSDLNMDILRENISKLMQDNKITQTELAEITKMSQPNVSKALKKGTSKYFTLEQVYLISQHFSVSIDTLIGNSFSTDSTSEKDICVLLSSLLESRKIIVQPITRHEEFLIPNRYDYDCEINKEDVTYSAFLFPNCYNPGPLDRYTEDEIDDFRSDQYYSGNTDESNIRINKYLTQFNKIYDMYIHNQIDQDMFHEIISKFQMDLK